MIYQVNHADGKWIIEPVLAEGVEKIQIISTWKPDGKILDALFDRILKSGAENGTIEVVGAGEVEFINNNRPWAELDEQNQDLETTSG
jgi:hypothetical protein